MIIVSQDKRMIINFDNIVGIIIRKNTDENIYQIQCKSGNEASKRILGKYPIEERAKEVLQEIIKVYKFYNGKTYYVEDRNSLLGDYENGVYVMPAEKVDDK